MKKIKEKKTNGNQSKKNNNKKKKEPVKSTVDNPFCLDFPTVHFGNYSKVLSQLKQSFNNFLTHLRKEADESLNTESSSTKDSKAFTKKLLTKSKQSYIIFGYNAVMRGLEKGKIKTVLVNSDTTPKLITKSFIPICKLKSIPLISVKNLSDIFSNEISIKSAIAIGFTLLACEKEGPFRNLYTECCKALGYGDHSEDLFLQCENRNPKQNLKHPSTLSNCKQSNANTIASYHLKRDAKNTRVFKPPKKEGEYDSTFIKLDKASTVNTSVKNSNKLNKRKSVAAISANKPMQFDMESSSTHLNDLPFFIDVDKDKHIDEVQEEDTRKKIKRKPADRYFEALTSCPPREDSPKRKQSHYIPTKIKRIKGNPNRHS